MRLVVLSEKTHGLPRVRVRAAFALVVAVCVFAAIPSAGLAAPGDLDPTFRSGGLAHADPDRTAILARSPVDTALPTISATAPFGNALGLDGTDDYANTADNTKLDLGDADGEDFTIESFFYAPDESSDANQVVFWKQYAYALSINFNPATPDAVIFRWWSAPIGSGDTLSNTTNLVAGWHHVAAVFDNEWSVSSDRAAIYLDGNELAGTTAFELTPGINNSTNALSVGANSGAASFDGWLEEARFSDTVRYSGSSYAVPSSELSPDAGTRALWHFNETACSTSFVDSSGNGNTLIGQNGAHTGLPGTAVCEGPGNTSPPTISGTATNGQTLNGNDGTWTGFPIPTLSRQWRRCDAAGANCFEIAGATTGSYMLLDADIGKTIRFRVTGTNPAGSVSADSAQTAVVSPATPPAAPSGLTATALSRSRIGLSWADNASNETGFRIERSFDGSSDWRQISTVAANVTTHMHARQRPLTTFFYRVCATNAAGGSTYSNVASATTLGW